MNIEPALRYLLNRPDPFICLIKGGFAQNRPFGQVLAGRKEGVEAGRIHLDIVRDLKRLNSHLAAAAYPILEGQGGLLPSRPKPN